MAPEELGRKRKDEAGRNHEAEAGADSFFALHHSLSPSLHCSVLWKDDPHRRAQWAPSACGFQVDLGNGVPCPENKRREKPEYFFLPPSFRWLLCLCVAVSSMTVSPFVWPFHSPALMELQEYYCLTSPHKP